MKLISMTDFVLEQQDKFKNDRFYQGQFKDNVVSYAKFLKQPLTLGMFIPCDDEGNVLKQPELGRCKKYQSINTSAESQIYHKNLHEKIEKYNTAYEKVLFEDFFYINHYFNDGYKYVIHNNVKIRICNYLNVERLIKLNVNLTKTAIKQIGL